MLERCCNVVCPTSDYNGGAFVGLLMINSWLAVSSFNVVLSSLVRLCFVMGCLVRSAISYLMDSKVFSMGAGASRHLSLSMLCIFVFLCRSGLPSRLTTFGGSIIFLSFFFALAVNALKSLSISIGSALGAVGTNDRPLLSRRVCGLVSCVSERLFWHTHSS